MVIFTRGTTCSSSVAFSVVVGKFTPELANKNILVHPMDTFSVD